MNSRSKCLGLAVGSVALVAVGWLAVSFSLACGARAPVVMPTYQPPPPPPAVHAPSTMLKTADTFIYLSPDESNKMIPGQRIDTPFQSTKCPTNPTTDNYVEAIGGGGRPVAVITPHFQGQLYGILSFCPMPVGTTGPASRLHLVQVPQEYVDATEGGMISVVYEPVSVPFVPELGGPGSVPGWILYLSREPYPELSQQMPVTPQLAQPGQSTQPQQASGIATDPSVPGAQVQPPQPTQKKMDRH